MRELSDKDVSNVSGGVADNPFDGPGGTTPIVIGETEVPKERNPFG